MSWSLLLCHSLVSRRHLCCSAEFFGMQGAVFINDSQLRLDRGYAILFEGCALAAVVFWLPSGARISAVNTETGCRPKKDDFAMSPV